MATTTKKKKKVSLKPPRSGAFTMYKKGRTKAGLPTLIVLRVPARAKRVHGEGGVFIVNSANKFRVSEAKVVSITCLTYGRALKTSLNHHERFGNYLYTVGKTAKPENGFDENRAVVCGAGINGFMTKAQAENYR